MRFVIDEDSLNCGDLEAAIAQSSLERLGRLLISLREIESELVGILGGWGGLICWRGSDLATVLSSDGLLARDERLLLLGLLSKCVHIDNAAENLDPEVSVDGGSRFDSYGIALVHASLCREPSRALAVVSLAHSHRVGAHCVACNNQEVEAFFVVDHADERLFWRSIYVIEDVPESEFFELTHRAFPNLQFAPNLSFGRFEGYYADVRPSVVHHLGALNDHWAVAYEEERGNSRNISARIGIDVSRESPNTRASEELMRERDVEFEGNVYRCEWHSKLEPHRNRIHFHPHGDLIDRPLVGIFCDHLPTRG